MPIMLSVPGSKEHPLQEQEFLARLALLRQEYAQMLPDKLCELRVLWDGLSTGEWSAEQLGQFIRLAHSLAGSAGTYGFPQVGARARALELAAKSLPTDTMPDTDRMSGIGVLMDELDAA